MKRVCRVVRNTVSLRMVNFGNPKICAASIQLRLALIYNRLSGRRLFGAFGDIIASSCSTKSSELYQRSVFCIKRLTRNDGINGYVVPAIARALGIAHLPMAILPNCTHPLLLYSHQNTC